MSYVRLVKLSGQLIVLHIFDIYFIEYFGKKQNSYVNCLILYSLNFVLFQPNDNIYIIIIIQFI